MYNYGWFFLFVFIRFHLAERRGGAANPELTNMLRCSVQQPDSSFGVALSFLISFYGRYFRDSSHLKSSWNLGDPCSYLHFSRWFPWWWDTWERCLQCLQRLRLLMEGQQEKYRYHWSYESLNQRLGTCWLFIILNAAWCLSESAKCFRVIQVIHTSLIQAYKLVGKFLVFQPHTSKRNEHSASDDQSFYPKGFLNHSDSKSIYIHLHGFIVSAHRKERFPSKRTKKICPEKLDEVNPFEKKNDDFLVQKLSKVSRCVSSHLTSWNAWASSKYRNFIFLHLDVRGICSYCSFGKVTESICSCSTN